MFGWTRIVTLAAVAVALAMATGVAGATSTPGSAPAAGSHMASAGKITGSAATRGALLKAANLRTRAGAARYLRSIGINARHFVIQRAIRNYAGARCPGTGWSCTSTAHPVIQIASAGGRRWHNLDGTDFLEPSFVAAAQIYPDWVFDKKSMEEFLGLAAKHLKSEPPAWWETTLLKGECFPGRHHAFVDTEGPHLPPGEGRRAARPGPGPRRGRPGPTHRGGRRRPRRSLGEMEQGARPTARADGDDTPEVFGPPDRMVQRGMP